MKRVFITLLVLLSLLIWNEDASAQSKTKDGTVTGSSNFPAANAVLELESANKGLLMPRVALTALNAAAPLSAHTAGMTVYNTATAGSGANAVSPGYYYNDGTKWIRVNIEPWYNKSTLAPAMNNTDTIYTMGQVGIGTNNPQSSLHIAGTRDSVVVGTTDYNLIAPTIRVEGMNAANNNTHPAGESANSVKPVFVNGNGDLLTGRFNRILAGSPYQEDDMPLDMRITSTDGDLVFDTLIVHTFTLDQSSYVTIYHDMSINGINNISDGSLRTIQTYLEFFAVPDNAPVFVGQWAGMTSSIYIHHTGTGGNTRLNNNNTVHLVLPPGTYTVGLMGSVEGGNGIDANFGDGTDSFLVIAQPL